MAGSPPPVPIRHVVVLGLMGAGKTTTGSLLAERFGWTWRDSDVDIAGTTGLTVRELRDREGVDAMHAREAAQLRDTLADPRPSVISAAASVMDDPASRMALTAPGVAVIWLHAPTRLLAGRFASDDAHRPAFGDDPDVFLAEQAAKREPLLAAIGAHVIDVDGLTPDEVVGRAMEALASIEA